MHCRYWGTSWGPPPPTLLPSTVSQTTCVHTHVHTHIRTACALASALPHVYTHTCTHAHTRTACALASALAHVYTHTCTHAHMHCLCPPSALAALLALLTFGTAEPSKPVLCHHRLQCQMEPARPAKRLGWREETLLTEPWPLVTPQPRLKSRGLAMSCGNITRPPPVPCSSAATDGLRVHLGAGPPPKAELRALVC